MKLLEKSKMKYYAPLFVLFFTFFFACKTGKKEQDKKYISVVSFIKKQVEHVDTSLYPIVKITSTDTLPGDTVYIPREEFAAAANDFLQLPDLSDPKVAKKYIEEKAHIDELLNRVIITYTPINPEKEEIKKQELLISPNQAVGDKVINIIAVREVSNRDSFLQKKLLWQMDKSFQVVTTRQKPGTPESVTIMKISWNEPGEQ